VDPNGTDRITFSNVAERLSSIGKRSSASAGGGTYSKIKVKTKKPTAATAVKPKEGRVL
jgi:hypothetical protein